MFCAGSGVSVSPVRLTVRPVRPLTVLSARCQSCPPAVSPVRPLTGLTLSRCAGALRKAALQEAAQPLCNASMTLPEAGGYYTAWSSMATLVKRKLVLRQGSPAS